MDVLSNETNQFYSPKMIASEVNENQAAPDGLGGAKSLTFNVTMKTTNDSVSPILDTQRTSLVVVNNKITNPTETNVNVGSLDENTLLSANTTIAFSGSTITTVNATARGILQTVSVGKYLTTSGSSNAANNGTFLITAVSDNGTTTTVTLNTTFTTESASAAITIKQREIFVSEIAPSDSTSYSKYVTKRINLANASNFLRLRFAASIPSEAAIEVYYRVNTVGSTAVFDSTNYTLLTPDAPVTYVQVGSNQFIDMNYSTGDIADFDAVQVKIVMKSANTSAVPRMKDLRIIACA
jgi:hypothetical protein